MDLENCRHYKSHGTGKFKVEDFKKVGDNIIIEEGVLVFHAENIELGKNVYIGHRTILKGYYKNSMVIEDNSWIGQGCFFHSAGGIRIGKSVGIAPGVMILTSEHKEDDLSKPILMHEVELNEVVIGDGCDIGVGTIILPGVKIGEGAIVGAGSVVTKDVPPYSVVAGVPTRVLRRRG
jgi:acetyltransferase-like isoleucine patch superfamily enzyme